MKNPRVTKKEAGLIKGALRRVFSRSDLRKAALDSTRLTYEYSDPNHKRVKKWSECFNCDMIVPTYTIDVDHTFPIVPVDKESFDLSPNELVDAMWCDPNNLRPFCKTCHTEKTQAENKLRRENRKKRKEANK